MKEAANTATLKRMITAIKDCQENQKVRLEGDVHDDHKFIKVRKFNVAGETRVTTPTVTETQLPWKRDDEDDADGGAIKQHEFPAWASNKEYLAYNSPSATFLGNLSMSLQLWQINLGNTNYPFTLLMLSIFIGDMRAHSKVCAPWSRKRFTHTLARLATEYSRSN